ncbi:MAG TPA: hypothetical protein VIL51_09300 [Thermoleophilia bacterium]
MNRADAFKQAVYGVPMPLFDIAFLRVGRDENPTVIEAFFLTVDWPFIPREGEGVEILVDFEAQKVESVGYGVEGDPLVHLGRVVLDDLQAAQLRKAGWRASPLASSR